MQTCQVAQTLNPQIKIPLTIAITERRKDQSIQRISNEAHTAICYSEVVITTSIRMRVKLRKRKLYLGEAGSFGLVDGAVSMGWLGDDAC